MTIKNSIFAFLSTGLLLAVGVNAQPAFANVLGNCGQYGQVSWVEKDYSIRACLEESNMQLVVSGDWVGTPNGETEDIYIFDTKDTNKAVFHTSVLLPSQSGDIGTIPTQTFTKTIPGDTYYAEFRAYNTSGYIYDVADSPKVRIDFLSCTIRDGKTHCGAFSRLTLAAITPHRSLFQIRRTLSKLVNR